LWLRIIANYADTLQLLLYSSNGIVHMANYVYSIVLVKKQPKDRHLVGEIIIIYPAANTERFGQPTTISTHSD